MAELKRLASAQVPITVFAFVEVAGLVVPSRAPCNTFYTGSVSSSAPERCSSTRPASYNCYCTNVWKRRCAQAGARGVTVSGGDTWRPQFPPHTSFYPMNGLGRFRLDSIFRAPNTSPHFVLDLWSCDLHRVLLASSMPRLIHTKTGQFVEVADFRKARYAILSHTWDPNGEQTYQDLKKIQESYGSDGHPRSLPPAPHVSFPSSLPPVVPTDPPSTPDPAQSSIPDTHSSDPSSTSLQSIHPASPTGVSPIVCAPHDSADVPVPFWNDPGLSDKVRRACEAARADGYDLLWIDSCCIDKTSSAELSEAINSMWLWYNGSAVCHAFLADVPGDDDVDAKDSRFRASRWFRRGWTLQELLAPRDIKFLSGNWTYLGSKAGLALAIQERTGIEFEVLLHLRSLDEVSVAKRMSWAADRETTRVEDRAYSLLGIFDINMPTLYGEGECAFQRLQELIIQRIPDQSIFAWTSHTEIDDASFGITSYVRRINYKTIFTKLHPTVATSWPEYRPLLMHPASSLFASSPSDFAASGCISPLPSYLPGANDSHAPQSSHPLHHREDSDRPLDWGLGRLHSGFDDGPIFEYVPTPHGMRSELVLSMCPHQENPGSRVEFWYFLILCCKHDQRVHTFVVRLCFLTPKGTLWLGEFVAPRDNSNTRRDASVQVHIPRGTLFTLDAGSPYLSSMGRYKVYIPGNYGRQSPDYPTDLTLTASDYYPWYFWSGHILSIALSPRSKSILEEQGYDVTFKARNMSEWSLLLSQCNTTLKIDFHPVPTEVPFVKITTFPSSDFSPDDRCEALAGVLEWQVSKETPSFMTFPRLVLTTSAGAELYLQLLLENYKPSFGYAQMLYVNVRPVPSQGPRAANMPFTDSRVLHGYRPLSDGFEPLGTTEPEDWPTGKWRRRRVAAVPTTEEADALARPNEPHDFRWFVRGIFELISTFHVV